MNRSAGEYPPYHPFDSPEAFILGCTDEIWAERGVGRIADDYYASDVRVHGAYGTVVGVGPVVEGTLVSLGAYPDEVARGEDVVWEARGGYAFISSHRVFSTATNTGWSPYGAPTNRPLRKRALAHCLVRGGRIVEEWVVRDEYRLVVDLGFDPIAVADRLARSRAWNQLELGSLPSDPLREGVSGVRRSDEGDEECERLVEMVSRVWNGRMLQQLSSYVAPDVVLKTSRGRTLQGFEAYSRELLDVLAPVPDGVLRIVDVCAHVHPQRGQRVALVWLLTGIYSGVERYGPTTGTTVELLGCTQYVLDHRGRIVEEYRVYDELGLLVQIEQARQQGDAPPALGSERR